MAGVSQEMLLEYIRRKGGRVKNVDLVKHFRKHLLFDDTQKKEQAREHFKELVNSIAIIKQEDGQKFLYLKDEFYTNSTSPSHLSSPARSSQPTSPPKTTPLTNGQNTSPTHHTQMKTYNGQAAAYDLHQLEHKSVSPQRNFGNMGSPSKQSGLLPNQSPLSPPYVLSPSLATSLSNHHYTQSSSSPLSSSVPTSSFFSSHANQGGHSHSPTHSYGGKGHKKTSLDISAPLSVQPLSNGSAISDISSESSFLQQITAELANFGETGVFRDSSFFNSQPSFTPPSSTSSLATNHSPSEANYPPPAVNHPPSVPGRPYSTSHHSPSRPSPLTLNPVPNSTPSESSLSSTSVQSSPPSSSEQAIMSPPIVTVTRTPSTSRGSQPTVSQVGVRALIQQYTGPPGTTPTRESVSSDTSDPNNLNSPQKVRRSASSASNHSTNANLQLKREPTPPESRVSRSQSNVGTLIRRSRHLDARNTNLDTLTRQSIKGGTHSKISHSHRLSKNSDELVYSNSKEELLSEDPDRDSPQDEYIIDIDPMEKEWMAALIDGNLDSIYQMTMADSAYINRKGFINGWTAMHWAAKMGREDMVVALAVSGGRVDIKSGLTPLHLAAESGHENVVRLLVNDYNASVNTRDHSGRKPLDMLQTLASESMRSLLRKGLIYHGLPRNLSTVIAIGVTPLNSFNIPRNIAAGPTLKKSWGSVGHLSEREVTERKKSKPHHLTSPRGIRKGFSFRRKKYNVNKDKRDSIVSEYYEPSYDH